MHTYPWHSLSANETIAHVSTSGTRGLSDSTAKLRLREYGKNILTEKKQETIFGRIARQLTSAIAIVLILAGAAALVLGEIVDATVIILALLVNVVIGLVQEGRAGEAFNALAQGEEKHALVLRDGKRIDILAEDIVVGDVLLLSAGKQIPADVRLIEASDLSVNEAALTGEWVPVPKNTEVLSDGTALSHRYNMGFRGTTIVSGRAKGVVIAVGDDTEVGSIAKELQKEVRTKTPLEKNMEGVARFILVIIAIVVACITILGLLRGESATSMLLVAIALAVSAIPEGLPAAVTASLAIGMERILKYGGLVKNLLAAEVLGTTTYVLTDKTGTLTKGRMALVEYAMLGERSKEPESTHIMELLRTAAHASDAVLDEDKGSEGVVVHGRPIERAIVLAAVRAGVPPIGDAEEFSIPFSSARRFGGAVVAENGGHGFFASGAPETLLHASTKVFDGTTERMITPADVAVFERYLNEYTQNGLRVIGIARRTVSEDEFSHIAEDPERIANSFTFMGLLVFADQIREDVEASISRICEAGARVVMVTGDNPNTAHYIACEVGLCTKQDSVVTGSDIDAMDDTELLEALKTRPVFARVLPIQKLRIARVLRSAGEVVAMTGDGINDAPALQAATIGIAVGSGTDVAKEAADLVLLDNSFSIIVRTIEEGRRLRDNIKKVITFLLSTNFSEVLLISVALIAGAALPILPTQILWANIVGGGLMNFAFAFEPADEKTMKRNPRDPEIATILSGNVIRFMLLASFITAGLLLILYFFLNSLGVPIEEIRTVMFVAVSFDAIFFAFSMKSFTKPIWQMKPFSNKYLVIALGVSILMLLAALSVPFLANLLSVVPLTQLEILLLALLGITNVAAIEFAKWAFFQSKKEA